MACQFEGAGYTAGFHPYPDRSFHMRFFALSLAAALAIVSLPASASMEFAIGQAPEEVCEHMAAVALAASPVCGIRLP
jgi:hypothetical protein